MPGLRSPDIPTWKIALKGGDLNPLQNMLIIATGVDLLLGNNSIPLIVSIIGLFLIITAMALRKRFLIITAMALRKRARR